MPTTRLQHPGYLVLGAAGSEEQYRLAHQKNGRPHWRRTQVQVQPGRGEQVVTWDHLSGGMGESRYKSGKAYEYNSGGTTTVPYKLCPGPDRNTITSFPADKTFTRLAEFNGYVYFIGYTTADNDLYYFRVDPSSPATIDTSSEVGAGQADGPPGQCAVRENCLYVGATAADAYGYQVNTSNTWSRGTDAETKEAHYCRVGRDMWSVSNVSGEEAKVRLLAAGATWNSAARGSQYIVGDSGRAINSLAEWGRWLYVGKPEGLFSGDTNGNMWNVLPAVLPNANNNLRLGHFLHFLMAPTTVGLYRHAGTTSLTVGIEEIIGNTSACKGGYFTALVSAGKWLYGAYKVGTATYLVTGRLRGPDDPPGPPMVWHIFDSVPNATVEDLRVTTLGTTPILYCVAGATGVGAFFYYLGADGSLDPTDSNYDFETSGPGTIYLPAVDLSNPGTLKRGHYAEIQGTGTWDATRKWSVYAKWDGGSGNIVGSPIASSGFNRVFWTKDSNDSGRSCQLYLVCLNGTAAGIANVPVIEKVSLNLIELPRVEPAFEAVVCLYDQSDRKRTVETQLSDLEALVQAGVYNCTDPNDPDDANISVILHPFEEYDIKQEGECSKHSHVRLTLREVKYA